MYKFQDEDVANALEDAARRGVQLTLVLDATENDSKSNPSKRIKKSFPDKVEVKYLENKLQ
jgi:hypothetical protein